MSSDGNYGYATSLELKFEYTGHVQLKPVWAHCLFLATDITFAHAQWATNTNRMKCPAPSPLRMRRTFDPTFDFRTEHLKMAACL